MITRCRLQNASFSTGRMPHRPLLPLPPKAQPWQMPRTSRCHCLQPPLTTSRLRVMAHVHILTARLCVLPLDVLISDAAVTVGFSGIVMLNHMPSTYPSQLPLHFLARHGAAISPLKASVHRLRWLPLSHMPRHQPPLSPMRTQ